MFNADQRGPNWASTRDLHLGTLPTSDNLIWSPDFDALLPTEQYLNRKYNYTLYQILIFSISWEFQSAHIDVDCVTSKRGLILLGAPNNSIASACSPPLDLSAAGNLRFDLEPPNQCKNQTKFGAVPAKLNVWIERSDRNKKKISILPGLVLKDQVKCKDEYVLHMF